MKRMIPVIKWIEEDFEDDIYNTESFDDLEEEDSYDPLDLAFMIGYLSS